jgi:type IV pilus biogenesis protein CpaD/CtpE
MKTKRCSVWLVLTGLMLGLISGCQGYNPETGMTLPSGYYLRHPPQYFPPSEPYPLPKELRSLEEAAKQAYDNPRP